MKVLKRTINVIPVLSICSFSETLRRFGASSDGACATCSQQVVRNIFVDSCVICVHSSHFDWPDKPWMYLEMSDTLRAMLYLSEMTRPNGLQTFCLITDANMLMCEKCFITFLEQIEDTCKETSYWPYVLQIRSKYAIRTPDYVPSSERPDTSFYPSILGPIEGGLDSNDISSSTEQTSSSDKLPL